MNIFTTFRIKEKKEKVILGFEGGADAEVC